MGKSIVAALPILKVGCCWRVGNGHSILVSGDKWIPNYPTNAPLLPLRKEVREVVAAKLIDPQLHAWRTEFIMNMFEQVDVEAICRIQLSQRDVEDTMIWLHLKKGLFTVKSAYKVAREVLHGGNIAESLRGCVGKRVWAALWKLRIPNKIKVFGWRACNDILPTKLNLSKQKIIEDAMCPICMRFPKLAIHALWECEAAKDVWAGSFLQKGVSGLADFLHVMKCLLDWIELHDMEEVLVQAWQIWNQRNWVVHGGKFHELEWLITRARELLEDFQTA